MSEHYFIPTGESDRCDYDDCALGVLDHPEAPQHNMRANYWTESEAQGDIDPKRCIHGIPVNVFCGKCEG